MEFRRRVHYGLELLLAAFASELRSECSDGRSSASIEEAITAWSEEGPVADIIASKWPSAGTNWLSEAEVALGDIDAESIWEDVMASRVYNSLPSRERAIAGLMLISACERMSRSLRDNNSFPNRSYLGEKALSVVRDTAGMTLVKVVIRLLSEVVLPAHLTTTLRKMGGGLKCSLRFFPDADGYRPTDIDTSPGFSGNRLSNIISMLRDVGVLDSTDEGYAVTEVGTELLGQLIA